jgi:hypothetical protein
VSSGASPLVDQMTTRSSQRRTGAAQALPGSRPGLLRGTVIREPRATRTSPRSSRRARRARRRSADCFWRATGSIPVCRRRSKAQSARDTRRRSLHQIHDLRRGSLQGARAQGTQSPVVRQDSDPQSTNSCRRFRYRRSARRWAGSGSISAPRGI